MRQGSSWRRPRRPALHSLPQKTKLHIASRVLLMLCGLLGPSCGLLAQTQVAPSQIDASDLDRQVRTFLQSEVAAHVADIKTLDPPPERVAGALTTGEFSWGSFMRALGAYSQCFETRTIADHDIPGLIGKMARIELSHGGKSWAQLYAAMALQSFGADLNRNVLWQSMSSEERKAYRELLNPARFYDE